MMDLDGRVAVVTGAASGIGRGLVEELLSEGMALVLADVQEAQLSAVVTELASSGARVLGVPTDVTDAASVEALADKALAEFGAVHVVCNNAGVPGTFGRTWTTPIDEWRWVLDVNLWGVINGVRTFVPLLVEQGEGHVVNTGSAAGFQAFPGMGPYGTSKHALIGLSESLHRELGAMGSAVGVTVLIPGGIVKSNIMDVDASWPARLGARAPADADPVASMVKAAFTVGISAGTDPRITAAAAVRAIKDGSFLVSDDAAELAAWGAHHAALARGEAPTWPPT
jgi:NAD(P)-dependent dehydrogenase (short-subunit alcohol dehydrogenase family)